MAIKWTTVYTEKGYKFNAALVSQSPYTFLVAQHLTLDPSRDLTLTNAIEQVLEHLIIGVGPELCRDMQVYQWCKGEGLFKVEWCLSKKFTRDMPPWAVTDVKWTKIANDLKAFEVLYA